uniref:REJ domain-containing protein n=1 Tax=Mycena chlorophos TaxID=658473 RepID=A0ABQ0LNM1_MYCCL|nr:predicted protein [Mycena chlorophos]
MWSRSSIGADDASPGFLTAFTLPRARFSSSLFQVVFWPLCTSYSIPSLGVGPLGFRRLPSCSHCTHLPSKPLLLHTLIPHERQNDTDTQAVAVVINGTIIDLPGAELNITALLAAGANETPPPELGDAAATVPVTAGSSPTTTTTSELAAGSPSGPTTMTDSDSATKTTTSESSSSSSSSATGTGKSSPNSSNKSASSSSNSKSNNSTGNSTATAASPTRTRPCDQGDQSLAAGLNVRSPLPSLSLPPPPPPFPLYLPHRQQSQSA